MMKSYYAALALVLSLMLVGIYTAYAQQVQLPVYIPAVNVYVRALSANGMPLTKYAIVGLTCAQYNVSGVGGVSVVIPIPSTGSITCTAYAYSFGIYANRTVTLTANESGETIPITLVIPVSGYYVPGIGFVPVGALVAIAVAIVIIIILIVIALIEYSNWRRRRLARLIKPPE